MTEQWLLMKRGLYYRPNACGYTGIRDEAGIYTREAAEARTDPDAGVSMIRLQEAPEFTAACFDDLARKHITKQRDDARAEIEKLRGLLRRYRNETPLGHQPHMIAHEVDAALANT